MKLEETRPKKCKWNRTHVLKPIDYGNVRIELSVRLHSIDLHYSSTISTGRKKREYRSKTTNSTRCRWQTCDLSNAQRPISTYAWYVSSLILIAFMLHLRSVRFVFFSVICLAPTHSSIWQSIPFQFLLLRHLTSWIKVEEWYLFIRLTQTDNCHDDHLCVTSSVCLSNANITHQYTQLFIM